jgi:hypothetical protein
MRGVTLDGAQSLIEKRLVAQLRPSFLVTPSLGGYFLRHFFANFIDILSQIVHRFEFHALTAINLTESPLSSAPQPL